MLVKLRDEAQVDLLEGAWFYEKKNDGLGERFIGFVQAELFQLVDNHGIHERVFGLHRKLVDRFPFAIYYLVNKDFVADQASHHGTHLLPPMAERRR